MIITLCSAWDDNMHELADLVMRNRFSYCERHNYALTQGPPADRSPVWWKVKAVEQAFETGRPDWVVWMDVDIWITNESIKLERWCQNTSADMLVTHDINGLNAGVLFFRNCDWSRTFLDQWWRMDSHSCASPEQSALAYLLPLHRDHFECRPQKEFNAYDYHYYGMNFPEGQWQEGDFLLHMPALPNDKRMARFKEVRTVTISK